jgi:GT2 family glycosyltransferase
VVDVSAEVSAGGLTVVVPCRNVVATLAPQLEALLAQPAPEAFEVLVVDNQSTDGTAELVYRLAQADSRLRLVRADEAAGLSYTRNVGIAAARYPNIAICDGDDVVDAAWVTSMDDALRTWDIVTGPLELDLLNPSWLAASRGRSVESGISTFYGIFPYAAGGNMGLRRQVWESLGGFATDVHGTEDIEFSLRAWRAGVEIGFARGAVVHYRYRQTAAELWRQGRAYGRCRPLVARMLREAGQPAPPRFAGWKSWVWLILHLTDIRSRAGRAAWAWVAANRVGQVEGSVMHRAVLL